MYIKEVINENFGDYKKISMLIGIGECDFKCCIDANKPISMCQNSKLNTKNSIYISNKTILDYYNKSKLTKSIIIGGLEPFLQFIDICELIECFRDNNIEDDFVIYTGYKEEELEEEIKILKQFKNIIIKFGRYIPDKESIFDETLGVMLASNNQYAKKIS